MHRVDSSGHLANLFTNGNPGTGQPATELEEDWHNDVQEELCNLIEAANITLVKGDQTQLQAALATGLVTQKMAGGTSNAVEAYPVSGTQIFRVSNSAGPANLHIVSSAGQDAAIRLIEAGGADDAWTIAINDADGQLRFASSAAADEVGGGAYLSQVWFEQGGGIYLRAGVSTAASGYCKITNGMMLQWGWHTGVVNHNSSGTKVFPTAFPTACLMVCITPENSANGGQVWLAVDGSAMSAASFAWFAQYQITGGSIPGFFYFAIGY
jgi:hypothetical protein